MADDLDDDWWSENSESKKRPLSDSSADEAGTSTIEKISNEETTQSPPAAVQVTTKKRKKKQKKEDTNKEDSKALVPDILTRQIKQHFAGKLSAVEVDELNLNELRFLTCNDMGHIPSAYLKLAVPKWKGLVKRMAQKPGAPLMLILSSSALRAAQLIRDIAEFKGDCKTAKLFAKHLKIEQQKVYLEKNIIGIGVGTPARIHALIDNDMLDISQLNFVIIDFTWRDVKLRRFMDIPEVKKDLMNLAQKQLLKHAGQFSFGLM